MLWRHCQSLQASFAPYATRIFRRSTDIVFGVAGLMEAPRAAATKGEHYSKVGWSVR